MHDTGRRCRPCTASPERQGDQKGRSMHKSLMYVVALALSVAVAACATQSHPTEVPRTAVLPANALHRCKATHDRQDCLTAFRELLPLAQQGYASAQNNLGLMYAEGRGIAKDDTEAVRWYRQAAAQGNAYAYANL